MGLSVSITFRLKHQHESIFELTKNLLHEQLIKEPGEGKWSILQNIIHLSTYQHAFIQRLDSILNENNPQFERYEAESDPRFEINCAQSSAAAASDLLMFRKSLTAKLLSLTDMQLQRQGKHPVYGQMDVHQWTEFFLLHEAHHVFTIFRLSSAYR